jgi:hypothetical protein
MRRAFRPVIGLLLAGAVSLFAGDKGAGGNPAIQSIRARYQEVMNEVQEGRSFFLKLTDSKVVPVIGQQTTEIKMYYVDTNRQGEEGSFQPVLQFVTVDFSVAASENDHLEYLFGSNGRLLFHLIRVAGYDCRETRLYFDAGKLVRLSAQPVSPDSGGCLGEALPPESNRTRDKGFSAGELAFAKSESAVADRYRRMFGEMIAMSDSSKGSKDYELYRKITKK